MIAFIYSIDGIFERGCLKRSIDVPTDVEYVYVCDGQLCNSQSYIHANCISCKGKLTDKCAHDSVYLSETAPTSYCEVGYEVPHCYISIINRTHVERGCVSTRFYHESMLRNCALNKEECFFCDGDNCNYFAVNLTAPALG